MERAGVIENLPGVRRIVMVFELGYYTTSVMHQGQRTERHRAR